MPASHANRLCVKSKEFASRFMSRDLWTPVLYGQILSLLICGTAVTSTLLVENYNADIPLTQSLCNYVLLALFYGSKLAFSTNEAGEKIFFQTMRTVGWKYLLLAVSDVMANYLIVKAYQFTSLTSVQVLDCFVIPVVMFLSWIVLKTRYKIVHFIGAGIALSGVACMISADVILGKSKQGLNPLLGDILVLAGATCYGMSNVGMEFFMKGRPAAHTEVLGMYGIFGTFISGTLVLCIERRTLMAFEWTPQTGGVLLGFTMCMFILYTCMPLVMKMSSAATVNLSILTADLYALFVGIYLFHYAFSPLYIVSFFVIFASLLIYNSRQPGTARNEAESSTDTPSPCDSELQQVGDPEMQCLNPNEKNWPQR